MIKRQNESAEITTDEQKLVFEYVKKTPRQTTEDIVNYFCGWGERWDYERGIYAGAVEFLLSNGYLVCDPKNQAITIKTQGA